MKTSKKDRSKHEEENVREREREAVNVYGWGLKRIVGGWT